MGQTHAGEYVKLSKFYEFFDLREFNFLSLGSMVDIKQQDLDYSERNSMTVGFSLWC